MAATVRSFRDYLRQRALAAWGVLMSLNDPQWGRRPGGGGNQGPPDLEELWRNFNRKLEGLFGRRRGPGDTPPGTPRVPPRLGGGAGLIAILVVLVWLASGFYIVPEGWDPLESTCRHASLSIL